MCSLPPSRMLSLLNDSHDTWIDRLQKRLRRTAHLTTRKLSPRPIGSNDQQLLHKAWGGLSLDSNWVSNVTLPPTFNKAAGDLNNNILTLFWKCGESLHVRHWEVRVTSEQCAAFDTADSLIRLIVRLMLALLSYKLGMHCYAVLLNSKLSF